jgi:hypothetical protein
MRLAQDSYIVGRKALVLIRVHKSWEVIELRERAGSAQ